MPNPVSAIANLSALLHLARHHPDDEAGFATGMDLFLASLGGDDLDMEASISSLWVNGRAMHSDSPGANELTEHLLVHDAGGLRIPSTVSREMLAKVIRVLSAPGGTYLTFQSLTGALGSDALTQVTLTANPANMVIQDGSPVSLDPAAAGGTEASDAEAGALILDPLPLEGAFARVDRPSTTVDPQAAESQRELRDLIERGRTAIASERWHDLFEVGLALVRGADEGGTEAMRQGYRVELRRLVTRRAIRELAGFAATGNRRREASVLLSRFGGDAAEVLMDLLIESDSMTERRGYFAALAAMPHAAPVVIYHLSHPTWYVVRNAAELCGDLDLVVAIPELAKQIRHEDERVRRAVAGALAKLGTAGTMEPIRLALMDSSAPVRLEALMHLDGRRRGRSLALVLAAMLDKEVHPDVRREMLRALGRIGTPDSLQTILRATASEGGFFRSRRSQGSPRIEAVRAIALAGERGVPALRTLAEDKDSAVRAAAEEALREITAEG